MFAKLVLLAEEISFDDAGRVSAKNLALDLVGTTFPMTIARLDLLTLWTRMGDEPESQVFELLLQTPTGQAPPERIPVDFKDQAEAWQGISLDGFVLEQPGPYIFRFTQGTQDRAVWILRAHQVNEGVGDA
jgi:hypothetical protein